MAADNTECTYTGIYVIIYFNFLIAVILNDIFGSNRALYVAMSKILYTDFR